MSPSGVRLELFHNGDVVDAADDRKTLSVALAQVVKDGKAMLTGKLSPVGGNLVSSPDSSSDSSTRYDPVCLVHHGVIRTY